eukprot:1189797-Prorocentrum_minimum.AAC.1
MVGRSSYEDDETPYHHARTARCRRPTMSNRLYNLDLFSSNRQYRRLGHPKLDTINLMCLHVLLLNFVGRHMTIMHYTGRSSHMMHICWCIARRL